MLFYLLSFVRLRILFRMLVHFWVELPHLLWPFIHSPTQALLVVIVILIIQQLDGNLISPLVIGKKLNTHPLTIIILLLVAGNIAGILGMILAVPAYSVVKTVILNIVKFVKLRKDKSEEILE